MDLSASLG
ncbi:hypothetical protein F383_38456 [Gossypium arboreum]|uniref:Uncharacterized protein n=1 Tax=Gossypium arboreum TaxID=29729 RepID=A0A0B0MJA0_GOSAR|nr:hypothetical protein F383_38456 [Gossypium arboreum]